VSATCFEPVVSSSGRWLYLKLGYCTFYIHQYKQSSHADAATTYHTVTAYTSVFLKMNPRVRNM